MEKKILTILIITAVVALIVGVALGIVLGTQVGPQKVKTETVNSLSSKVLASITAFGQVSKIDGKTLTINNAGDSLAILISDNARIFSLTPASATDKTKTGNTQKTVAFGDIKIGDKVNVVIKVLPNGQIQGSSVIIFPALSK